VNADSDNVSRRDDGGIDQVQRFIDDVGISPSIAGRGGEDVQPSRRNDGDAERDVARVNQVDTRLGSGAVIHPRCIDGVGDESRVCHLGERGSRTANF